MGIMLFSNEEHSLLPTLAMSAALALGPRRRLLPWLRTLGRRRVKALARMSPRRRQRRSKLPLSDVARRGHSSVRHLKYRADLSRPIVRQRCDAAASGWTSPPLSIPSTGSFHFSRRHAGTGGHRLRWSRHQCGDHFPVDHGRQSSLGRRRRSVQRAQRWKSLRRLSDRRVLDRHFSFHRPSCPRSFDLGHDAARLCGVGRRELSGVARNRDAGIMGDRESLSI